MTSQNVGRNHNLSWQQTMLRIKDPKISVPFYEKNFGMRLIHTYTYSDFSLYFMETPNPDEVKTLIPGTPESEKYLWSMQGTCLELTHNHGSENDPNFRIDNGNIGLNKRFGHIAFNCNDVHEAVNILDKNGVKFRKRPDEGTMKTMAFALDPDGYWIEIVKRGAHCPHPEIPFNFSQTMIRITNPEKSLHFYKDLLGMTLISVRKFSTFELYFLAYIDEEHQPKDTSPEGLVDYYKSLWYPILELTYNYPESTTQIVDTTNKSCVCKDEKCICENSACVCTDECKCVDGFGHIGMLCTGLEATCNELLQAGVKFRKLWNEGRMQGIAFAYDPDGYQVELIERHISF